MCLKATESGVVHPHFHMLQYIHTLTLTTLYIETELTWALGTTTYHQGYDQNANKIHSAREIWRVLPTISLLHAHPLNYA